MHNVVCYALVGLSVCYLNSIGDAMAGEPVRLIFDTDMGNDVDDALALGTIHALVSRGECNLLAVTVSKDNPLAARYCDLVNTFYGRGEVPIGRVRNGKKPENGKFLSGVVEARDHRGNPLYPHTLSGESDTPDATELLRELLAAQPDKSVVIVVVGFSTNLARLLDSTPDSHSQLDGPSLVAQKVRLLSMMGGHFGADRPDGFQEYNIRTDLPASKRVLEDWPTPIIISGYEIGTAIHFPAVSVQNDFNYVPHHPLKDAYELYNEMPYDRPTWDLTSVLVAVRPDRNYFGLSEPGWLGMGDEEYAIFTPDPQGTRRCLTVTQEQIVRVREALVQLASQPPGRVGH